MNVTSAGKFAVCISDINLSRDLAAEEIADIITLFDRHHILIFKNQVLSKANLIRISKWFGEPVPSLVPEYRMKSFPLITIVSNIKDKMAKSIGVVGPHYKYHSDSYCTDAPCNATILYSLISPVRGGETNLVNTVNAYNDLSDEIKTYMTDKKVMYRNAYINRPPVMQPLFKTTAGGIKSLYINKYRALGIVGEDEAKSKLLLANLYDHATQEKYLYAHRWQNGDLVVWNNFTTMHCSTPIAAEEQRLLYRIIIKPR